MKCPYWCLLQTVTQTKYEYDDEGKIMVDTTIQNQSPKFIDCIEEECAAFYDGRCHCKG